MRELVETIARGLVDSPEDVVVDEIAGKDSSILQIACHPDDVGCIIGKNGKTIKAIRWLVSAIANHQPTVKRYIVDILEDGEPNGKSREDGR